MDEDKKTVVFAVLVSWHRDHSTAVHDERRPNLKDEYKILMEALPEGTALYIARNELCEIQYEAVVVLRGSLATTEDVMNWMNKIQGFEVCDLVEPKKEQKLEEFFKWTQTYFGRRGASVYGPELSVVSGDNDTQTHLDGLSGKSRYENGAAERLTQDMRRFQTPDKRERAAHINQGTKHQ